MSKIELRLSDVDPPEPEPKRTIYRDIANLPDPTKLGLTVRYFNHDDIDLYFQITGEADGYTFDTVNLGLLASGANAYRNLDEFASRAKPSESELADGELEETIKLILKAYTDSEYTNLKWTYEKYVTVHWINSLDPAWTVDMLNDFDDGTVQGWAGEVIKGGGLEVAVATDYVLSPPYSIRLRFNGESAGACAYENGIARLYKSITTPNKDKVFAIIDARIRPYADAYTESYSKNLKILKDDEVLVYIGKPYTAGAVNDTPVNKWIRIVVPLPKNQTFTLRVQLEMSNHCTESCPGAQYIYMNMDDFKIISK